MKPTKPRPKWLCGDGRRAALERLDEALARKATDENHGLIRAMRLNYFADVDKLDKSGEVVLPP